MIDPTDHPADAQAEALALVRGLRARIEAWQAQGVTDLPRESLGLHPSSPPGLEATAVIQEAEAPADREPVRPLPPREATRRISPPTSPRPSLLPGSDPGATAEATTLARDSSSLADLAERLQDCRRCRLCEGRTNVVFGCGPDQADLMFIGEGPGQEEDQMGQPFVGAAGKLLTNIIERGMGLRREEVYIANVVKCRPPKNRTPEADEVSTCRPFLLRQIEMVAPRAIVTLGAVATRALCGDDLSITRVRGKWRRHGSIPVMPTFHPAYLLYNPAEKRLVWEDIQLVMKELGLPRGEGSA